MKVWGITRKKFEESGGKVEQVRGVEGEESRGSAEKEVAGNEWRESKECKEV